MLKAQKIEFYKKVRAALIAKHSIDQVVNKADKTYVDQKFIDMTDTLGTRFDSANTAINNLSANLTSTVDQIRSETTSNLANAIATLKGDVDPDHDTLKELADEIAATAAAGADEDVTVEELNAEE